MTREATPEDLIAELDRVADALEGLTLELRHVGVADGCDEADATCLRSRVRA